MERTEPFRILAIDGGGVGGIIPSRLIERLLVAHPTLLEKTDIFAGTSTGGLIALGLAKGMTPTNLVNVYRDDSEKIFGRNMRRWKVQAWSHAKYDPKGLREVVTRLMGESQLKDLAKPVFIPVVALKRADSSHKPAGIFLSTINRLSPGVKEQYRSSDWRCVDAAMATSAAPTYFPAHVVKNQDGEVRWRLWDGGLVANNPSLAAVCELSRVLQSNHKPNVRVLSLGTGFQDFETEAGDWGQLPAALPVIKTLLDVSVGSTHFYMSRLFGKWVFRLTPKLKRDRGDNYDLDDYSAVPRLEQIADNYDLAKPRKTAFGPAPAVLDWLQKHW